MGDPIHGHDHRRADHIPHACSFSTRSPYCWWTASWATSGLTFDVFKRIFQMPTFTQAITNTLKVGFLVGILSALVGLLFAYVEVYVRMDKFAGGLFKVVSMLPVVSPPFVLSRCR